MPHAVLSDGKKAGDFRSCSEVWVCKAGNLPVISCFQIVALSSVPLAFSSSLHLLAKTTYSYADMKTIDFSNNCL